MHNDSSKNELEAYGVELAGQGKYAEAREIFQKVLATKTVPLHQAQVLRNIGLTYEREGEIVKAVEIYEQLLETPGLCDSNDGVYIHGQITGHLRRLQGGSFWSSSKIYSLFAAYWTGAATGAALGTKAHGIGFTIIGEAVNQDLRYGGAALGAIIGIFIYSRIFALSGPILSWLGGIISAILVAYILISGNLMIGLFILSFLIIIPFFIKALMSARFRNV